MKIPGFIRNDPWRKLVALLCAIIVYFSIWYQQREEHWIRGVRVVVRPAGREFIMTDKPDFRTDILVRCPSGHSDTENPNNFTAEVRADDAVQIEGGVYELKLTTGNFRSPSGFKVLKVATDKSTIRLQMQRRITKELPVKPRFEGKLAEDFRAGRIEVEPRRVKVVGPENEVEQLKELFTRPVPLGDAEETFSFRPEIDLPSSLTAEPHKVKVEVTVVRAIPDKVWKEIPVALLCDRGTGFEATFVEADPRVSVTVRNDTASPAEVVTPAKLSAFVDVTRLSSPGIHKVNVECHIREGKGTVRAIHPAEFSVKIVKTKVK